jgi:hypothetical protein
VCYWLLLCYSVPQLNAVVCAYDSSCQWLLLLVLDTAVVALMLFQQ